MTDLGLKTFDKLYPMLIHKYKDLIIDQNATEKDKINQIIVKLNALGKLSNDVVRDWNTVYQWVMNDGLTQDVNNKLEAMKANGEFDTLVATVVALIGDLSTLETTSKDTVVHALNEVDELAKANQSKIGDLTTLTTVDKDTLVHAINDNVTTLSQIVPLKPNGTDDTTNIQNAINSLPNGGQIQLWSGNFIISNTISILKDNISIVGKGLSTILSFNGSGSAFQIGYSDYSNTINNVSLKNFSLDGGNSPSGQDNFGVAGYRTLYCEIDIKISNFNKTTNSKGIKLDGGYGVNSNYFCATNTIKPRIGQCSHGIFLDNCVQNTIIIGGVVDGDPNNRANYAYGININDVHSAGNLIIGTDVEDCNVGVRVNGVQNQLLRPRIENCNTKFLQDTNGSQTHIVSSWGLDDSTTITNNGGQLKASVMGYDQFSQLAKVLSPSSGTAGELDIIGGSSSNAILKLFKGTNQVLEMSNLPGGNDIRFFTLQADNIMHETFGFRTNGYVAKAYLKGLLTFDNSLNAGDVPNGSLFVQDSTGKLSYKDSTGTVNALY